MKNLKCLCYSLFFMSFYCSISVASAVEKEKTSFEKSFYGISQITHLGIDTQRFKELSQEQRKNVILAKTVLFNTLKAVEDKNGKPNQYLSNELNKKFPSKRKFAMSILDEDASIVALIIEDFSIAEGDMTIKLECSIISFSEGSHVVSYMNATMQNTALGWKLSELRPR